MIGELHRPTQADVDYLAEHMAEKDKAECIAGGHGSPERALAYSILGSRDAWTWAIDGKPVCIFGLSCYSFLAEDEFAPWLLATEELKKYPRFFLRGCKQIVQHWQKEFGRMRGYVDIRHDRAVRWIHWMGFRLLHPQPMGPQKVWFFPFVMEASDDAAQVTSG